MLWILLAIGLIVVGVFLFVYIFMEYAFVHHKSKCVCNFCKDSPSTKALHYGLNMPDAKTAWHAWWVIKCGPRHYFKWRNWWMMLFFNAPDIKPEEPKSKSGPPTPWNLVDE